ncbi:hypothetical protein BMI86_02030 [Thioclava sp. DLFJ5-1]|uniref:lysozyme inhibitor LprI family protein n=1 Tax=Thioclava sp. DLFJ5-1 TaxID=1915314 RepID=UPI0009989D27|nr:lysozyme inhibitor LprI family protein [Thioclava sp. DLFJ5-1]OOY21374.1 hypothetical protein BMI86_02030 [Thioclava sp. DLFJ5-1]
MKTLWMVAVAMLGLSATAARAEGIPVTYDPQVITACLSAKSGPARSACIGLGAAHCMTVDTAGSSNAGMGFCFGAERDDWDARLNAAYQTIVAQDGKMDAELKELGSAAPPQVPALKEMQRAWIAYRDASCTYEMSTWGGGSGAGPAGSQCEMQLTGAQALRLIARAEQLEGDTQ